MYLPAQQISAEYKNNFLQFQEKISLQNFEQIYKFKSL